MKIQNGKKFLEKTFNIQDVFRLARLTFFISILTYAVFFFLNRWTIEIGGISKNQMRYVDYPIKCEKDIDIHRGAGSNFQGNGLEYLAAFAIKDREFSVPVQRLIDHPECLGYSIRAGIDAKPHGGGSASQSNVRLVFTDGASLDPRKGRKVVTVTVEYHD